MKITTLILMIFFLFSCKSKPSRNELLKNFAAIMTQIEDANDKLNPLVTKMNEVIDIAIDRTQPFDATVLDTLKIQYQETQRNLDLKIKSLSSIDEIDNELKIKEKSIQYLEDAKRDLQEMFPPTFEIIKQKFNDMTPDQRAIFNNIGKLGRDSKKRAMTYANAIYSFERKYKITSVEIDQYGL